MNKILVIRGGAIGDFILTLPVLSALREAFPESHLEVLGYPHIAELARAGGLAAAVRPIEARALATFFGRHAPLPEAWAHYFSTFAVILSYLYDPDEIFQTNIRRCSEAQFIQGPHRPNESISCHATEVYLKPLERLAIFDPDPRPNLRILGSPEMALPQGKWVAVHPGSGSEGKNWPEPQWRELLLVVMERTDWNLLMTGGEAEGESVRRLMAALPADRVHLAFQLPLTRLAEVLPHCAGFVGHDSGISHLAAALGLPVLVLWSHTNPEIWEPRSPSVHRLRSPFGLSRLDPEEVFSALQTIFGEGG